MNGGDSALEFVGDLASISALFDAAGLMTGVMEEAGGDFRFVAANAQTAKRYGLTPDKLIGRTGTSLGLPASVRKAVLDQIDLCHRQGPQRSEIIRQVDGQDRTFFTLSSAAPPAKNGTRREVYVSFDVTAHRRADQSPTRNHHLMEAALDAAAIGVWESNLATDILTLGPGCASVTGWSEASIPLEEFHNRVHPEDKGLVIEAQDSVQRGDTGGLYRVQHRIVAGDGGYRWIESSGRVTFDAAGQLEHAFGAVRDISEQVAAREHQMFLLAELNHRVKNNLAVIDAIARFTLRAASDLESFGVAFSDRLGALAGAHDFLSSHDWRPTELRDLIQRALDAAVRPITLIGPSNRIMVGPERALSMAIVFNELAANAAKHGALSTPEGQVSLTWTTEDDLVRIVWLERGGPPVAQDRRPGFGERILKRGLGDHEAQMSFEPEGLRVTMLLRRSPSLEF